ncbi:MAG: tyrosine--tRNA ligase [Candidatus Saelkia tenebricola]|nr:tyrosine--tRNA ligase [Candidatus Saelkia tenebricola]
MLKNLDSHQQLEIIKRGVEEVVVEEDLIKKLEISIKENRPLNVKSGFDPSAPDLHLGHMVLLKKLRDFQELGHEVYFLIGDFTARIGDPSGQKETRPRLTKTQAEENAKTYKKQIFKVLDSNKTKIVFNSQWLEGMSFEDVLELTSHYTVARILERDDFMLRYKEGKPISVTEFLYPLIQGYDSVALKADVELGGRDQKFNLLVGRELQKDYGQTPQTIITLPILEGTDGVKKMSKSFNNYIGIQESPTDMFGKIMSIPDSLIERYAILLTNLDTKELSDSPARDAKLEVACAIVSEIYGAKEGENQKESFIKVFSNREVPVDIEEYKVALESLSNGKIWIVELITLVGFASSGSEARRLIKQGAVSIDGDKVSDENIELNMAKDCILRVGRYRFKRIIV